jgi:hypothetical protein
LLLILILNSLIKASFRGCFLFGGGDDVVTKLTPKQQALIYI